MTKATSVISVGPATGAGSASFKLSQNDYAVKSPDGFQDWLDETGRNVSGASLISAWYQYLSGCEEDGQLCVTLKVRLSDIGLVYLLRKSYGALGEVYIRDATRTEYLAFSLDMEKSVDFGTITSCEWDGEVLDVDGETVSPTAVPSGGTASVSQKVLGVLKCQVYEQWYEHDLTITPRTPTADQAASEDDISSDLYASTCWLFCEGGVDEHKVKMPDSIGTCSGGYGGSTVVTDPDEEGDEETYTVMRGIISDYCSGVQIENPSVWVGGVLMVGKSIDLLKGTYSVRVTAPGYTPSDEDDLTENDFITVPKP